MSAKRKAAPKFKSEAEMVAGVESDLIAACHESRFDDVLIHLDELLGAHKNTQDDALRARCAVLLSAPATVKKAA